MTIPFYKYQGAGNDFVIIDDRELKFNEKDHKLVNKLCDRRFGIGADGLMLLRNHSEYDFEMIYFNSDGNLGSMCGNGGRCIVAFAKFLGVFSSSCNFIAVDGPHEAFLIPEKNWVSLKMIPVNNIEPINDDYFLDTGSPHYVVELDEHLNHFDVYQEGKKIRNSSRFIKQGTNVNFVEFEGDLLKIRTYERGVENETLACGTGVTASVLAMHQKGKVKKNICDVSAKGGDLRIEFDYSDGNYDNIWLQGPAELVFKGSIDVK